MRPKFILGPLLAILLSACQQTDEMSANNAQTDTFILVDYHDGVYKFVQRDNHYTIGVVDGLLEVPADFICFSSMEKCTYYEVDMQVTGIDQNGMVTLYQRYTGESYNYQVRKVSDYCQVNCTVQRVAVMNDYVYYVSYD
ncbi:MAG: hypothetical protein LUE98_11325 [Tannerellaceae bacterium]|nr:hypothetical protein [Tannerellaceae bacterium]